MKICKQVKKNLFAIAGDPTALTRNTKSRRKKLRKMARHIYWCEHCQQAMSGAVKFLNTLSNSAEHLSDLSKGGREVPATLEDRVLRIGTACPDPG